MPPLSTLLLAQKAPVAQCEVGSDRRGVDAAASAARVGANVVLVGELRHPRDLESALDTVDDGSFLKTL